MKKTKGEGRYLQLPYYLSDANEAMILQAGLDVGRFLDVCVEDAVKRANQNLEGE